MLCLLCLSICFENCVRVHGVHQLSLLVQSDTVQFPVLLLDFLLRFFSLIRYQRHLVFMTPMITFNTIRYNLITNRLLFDYFQLISKLSKVIDLTTPLILGPSFSRETVSSLAITQIDVFLGLVSFEFIRDVLSFHFKEEELLLLVQRI